MENSIIISILSLIGTIAIAILGYFSVKKQSKSGEIEASSSLISTALAINKQELETARVLNSTLLENYNDLEIKYNVLCEKQKDLSTKYDELYSKYQECITKLGRENDSSTDL